MQCADFSWRRLARLLPLVLCVMAVACSGDKVVQGPTTVADPPQISCPAAISQVTPTGQPMTVSFQPTVTLGAEPVTTTCTPASGST